MPPLGLAAAKVGFTALNLDANYISDEGVEEVKSVLEGAGISAALMSMEENDADMADEVDDDQAASLNAMLDHLKILKRMRSVNVLYERTN